MQCFELNRGHPEAECFRVAFLKLTSHLAGSLGYEKKPYDRQLSEMRYAGKESKRVVNLEKYVLI